MEAAKQESQTVRYYSKVAGSKFIMPDGKELYFYHGFLDLKEADYVGEIYMSQSNEHKDPKRDGRPLFDVYKEELDTLIRAGNPLLYVQGKQPEALPKVRDSRGREGVDINAHSEIDVIQRDAALVARGAVLSGDVNGGHAGLTDVNSSTVDPELKGMVLKDNPIRAAAAARNAAANVAATTSNGTSSHS